MNGYRLFLLFLLAIAVTYTVAARLIPMDAWTAAEAVNTRTLPTVFGVLLTGSLLGLFFRSGVASGEVSAEGVKGLGYVCGFVVLFALSIGLLNLWISLALLLPGLSWSLGERRLPVLVGMALVIPLLGYIGIEQVLGVYLPH